MEWQELLALVLTGLVNATYWWAVTPVLGAMWLAVFRLHLAAANGDRRQDSPDTTQSTNRVAGRSRLAKHPHQSTDQVESSDETAENAPM